MNNTEVDAEALARHHRTKRERKGFACEADPTCPMTGSNTIMWHPNHDGVVDTATTNIDHVCPRHRSLYDSLNNRTVIRLIPRCLDRSTCTAPATHAVTYVFVHGADKRPKTINACDEHGEKFRFRPKTFTVIEDREMSVHSPEAWAHEFDGDVHIGPPQEAPTDTTSLQFIAPQ